MFKTQCHKNLPKKFCGCQVIRKKRETFSPQITSNIWYVYGSVDSTQDDCVSKWLPTYCLLIWLTIQWLIDLVTILDNLA